MVKQTITREQLEQLIREELINEGFLDRVMARTQGNKSALQALGQRGLQAAKLVATGKADLSKVKDPKLVKSVAMAVQRIKSYENKFGKLLADFTNDLETMFGGDLGKAPHIKSLLDRLDNSATQFAKQITDIGKEIEAKVTSPKDETPPEPEQPNSPAPEAPSTMSQDTQVDEPGTTDLDRYNEPTKQDLEKHGREASARFKAQQAKRLGSDTPTQRDVKNHGKDAAERFKAQQLKRRADQQKTRI